MTLKRRLEKLEKRAASRSAFGAVMGIAFVWLATEKSIAWPFAVPPAPLVYPLQQTGIGGRK